MTDEPSQERLDELQAEIDEIRRTGRSGRHHRRPRHPARADLHRRRRRRRRRRGRERRTGLSLGPAGSDDLSDFAAWPSTRRHRPLQRRLLGRRPPRRPHVAAGQRPRALRRQRVGRHPLRRRQGRVAAARGRSATPAASGPNQAALPMMIDMDDPAHLQRRKLVNKGFTPRRVRDSEPLVRQACTRDHRRRHRAGRVRPRQRRRRPPADDHDRRRARRAPGAPRRPPALVRRHAQGPGHRGDRRAAGGGRQRLRRVHALRHRGDRRPAGRARRRPDEHPRARRGRRRPAHRRRDHPGVAAHPHRRRRDHPPRHLRRRPPAPRCTATSGSAWRPTRRARPAAVEEMLRWVTPIKNMVRTATQRRRARRPADPRGRRADAPLPVGQPRRGRVRRPVPLRQRPHARTSTSPSASAPTSASAPAWPASRSR